MNIAYCPPFGVVIDALGPGYDCHKISNQFWGLKGVSIGQAGNIIPKSIRIIIINHHTIFKAVPELHPALHK